MQFNRSNARFSRFWLVIYSSACQARDPTIAVDHFHISGHRSDTGIGEVPDQARNRLGIHDGIGVNRNNDFTHRFTQRVVQRRRLAVIGL